LDLVSGQGQAAGQQIDRVVAGTPDDVRRKNRASQPDQIVVVATAHLAGGVRHRAGDQIDGVIAGTAVDVALQPDFAAQFDQIVVAAAQHVADDFLGGNQDHRVFTPSDVDEPADADRAADDERVVHGPRAAVELSIGRNAARQGPGQQLDRVVAWTVYNFTDRGAVQTHQIAALHTVDSVSRAGDQQQRIVVLVSAGKTHRRPGQHDQVVAETAADRSHRAIEQQQGVVAGIPSGGARRGYHAVEDDRVVIVPARGAVDLAR